MSRKKIYHIIEWSVAIAACGWLVWKMATYEDYAGLWAALQGMGWKEWGALVLCVALMPVNMGLEAWRWKTLWNGQWTMDNGQWTMSFSEAQRQVYYSKLAGLVTPWRLGEYPSRAIIMARESQESRVKSQERNPESVWPKVLSMGVVGSATMTFAIILAGVPAIMANGEWCPFRLGFPRLTGTPSGEWWIVVGALLLMLIVVLVLAPRMLRRWATVSHRLIIKSVGQSVVRLVCWCVQLALVLYALGAVTGYGLWVTGSLCFIYYLLVTITPNVPIAEAGVRGSWAMVVFGTMNAAMAGVLLWIINTLLPCVVWFFIKKNTEKKC